MSHESTKLSHRFANIPHRFARFLEAIWQIVGVPFERSPTDGWRGLRHCCHDNVTRAASEHASIAWLHVHIFARRWSWAPRPRRRRRLTETIALEKINSSEVVIEVVNDVDAPLQRLHANTRHYSASCEKIASEMERGSRNPDLFWHDPEGREPPEIRWPCDSDASHFYSHITLLYPRFRGRNNESLSLITPDDVRHFSITLTKPSKTGKRHLRGLTVSLEQRAASNEEKIERSKTNLPS